jgi:iron complex transport system ATP-binding protein
VGELRAEHLRLAYDDRVVVDDLSVLVPAGRITVVVGANACGSRPCCGRWPGC